MTYINRMDDIYPLTIIMDRHTGTYSGGIFTAWNLDFFDIPKEIEGEAIECQDFFADTKIIYGIGRTANEAFENLFIKLTAKS